MVRKIRAMSDNEKHKVKQLIFMLFILGAILLVIKNYYYGEFSTAAGDQIWTLRIEAVLDKTGEKSPVYIARPFNTAHVRTIGETTQHPGLQLKRVTTPNSLKKELVATPALKGFYQLNIEYKLHFSPVAFQSTKVATTELISEQRQHYLMSEPDLNLNQPDLSSILKKLNTITADKNDLIRRIFDYTHKKTSVGQRNKKEQPSALVRARVMIALCRKSQIPARLVTGFVLKDQKDFNLHYWVQTFQDNKWVSHDPEAGYFASLPKTYVTTRFETPDLIKSKYPPVDLEIELIKEPNAMNLGSKKKPQYLDILDLTRLSLDTRDSLSVLLLLPLGALLTAFFRHLVGLRPYGIFTPPLLALAILYSEPVTTIITFLIVITLSITGRSFLPGSMSRSPRLTIVYTLVALSLVLCISILDYFHINAGGRTILLPVVILANLVDGIYSTLDDNGINIAMRRLGWTVLIAFFCFFLFRLDWLGHWLIRYPEFHLFTLAIALWLPLYKGKTCVDLKFCKWMKEPLKSGKKNSGNEVMD